MIRPPFRFAPAMLALVLFVAGCGPLDRLKAIPPATGPATVAGLHDIRYWGDEASPAMVREGEDSVRREIAYRQSIGLVGAAPTADFLAISGGGEDGAYGAGLLVGWTAAGTRPEFKLVTGISTGALSAPFAFLGPAYDKQLTAIYTSIGAEDVLAQRNLLAAVLDDGLADNGPLRRTVARFLDQALLDAIAEQHRRGRILLIGTTNLDAGRPVIWNIGKIAASGAPGALKLVQDILLASAAIPGAFPPSMIPVRSGGQDYEEMHVDGGASAQVFVYPPAFDLRRNAITTGVQRPRRLYVIRNARLDPNWAQVNRRTLSIAGRAISTLIQMQGIGDLYRMFAVANRDGVAFNLANIPESFTQVLASPFETAYMRALYRVGYADGQSGAAWRHFPPGYQAIQQGTAKDDAPPTPAP